MIVSELYNIFKKSPTICTDSRNIIPNSIFFALKGENFNGNKFAEKAIQDGCNFAVIDEQEYLSDKCILVEDVKEYLQKLATYHRNQVNIPIVGITGTNGKTTTKELIHTVLSSQYNCYATKGNLNNQIGVPLSILEINDSHEIAVIEMGASEIKEIEKLSNIAQPTSGIITNIGKAHLEGFGTLKGVIEAKTELYKFIENQQGIVFVNSENDLLLEESKSIKRITYGKNSNADYNSKIINKFPFISLQKNQLIINSKLIGSFQCYNILAACAIGNYYNISDENLKKSIEKYSPKNNRTEIVKTSKNYIILDAYNANPSSMKSMIDSFIELKKENKLCILGEMRELGEYSEQEHNALFKMMRESEIETIFIGEEFLNISSKNIYKNTAEFLENIKKVNTKNRTILIKGSRGIKLEELVEHL